MITSLTLIGLFISDFIHADLPPVPPSTETSYTEEGTGELLLSVKSSEIYGSVARGAARVPLMNIDVSSSCDADVTVESITLKHTGLGDVSDIDSVYLVDGFRRVSRGRSFDRGSQEAELRTPHFVVPACSAVRLQALADFSRDAAVGSEHAATLGAASSVQSDAKSVTVDFAGSNSETVSTTPDRRGNVSVDFLPINNRLRYGRRETVARIQLSADATNSFLLKRIVLKNFSTARDMDLIDLRIEKRSGEVLTAPVQRMRGSFATFEFSPSYVLDRSQTLVFLVTATINGSQNRKVNFGLEEPSDLLTTLYRPRR